MTVEAEKLRALAERVEAATGPDRELDGEIDRLLHDRPKDGDYDETEHAIWRVKDGWSGLLVRGDGFARNSFCAASYTASLDAALTLVPSEAFWRLGHDGDGADPSEFRAQIIVPKLGVEDAKGVAIASTPALAFAAAGLRALANNQGKEREDG